MIRNRFTLYKTVDENILTTLDIKVLESKFYYSSASGIKELTLGEELYTYYLGNVPEFWEPNSNDLIINRTLNIKDISLLFSEEGLTNKGNKLGLGAIIYSRTSDFSIVKDLDYELDHTMDMLDIHFTHVFLPAVMRGKVQVEIFIYLKDSVEPGLNHASEKGTQLGLIDAFEIVVDGDGSAFPIVEVEKPGEPLWKLITSWNDVNSDYFESDNVKLELNRKHGMYDYIFRDSKPSRTMLFEIMSNVMTQIIYKVINDELYDSETSEEQSITSIIDYWIETYQVQTGTFESISYTLRESLEKGMIE